MTHQSDKRRQQRIELKYPPGDSINGIASLILPLRDSYISFGTTAWKLKFSDSIVPTERNSFCGFYIQNEITISL
jgi:hypothetical protein